MSTLSPLRAFIADIGGSIEVVGADEPHNIDLGATQPIDIAMPPYLPSSTTNI